MGAHLSFVRPEEYLALEREAIDRHQFISGKIGLIPWGGRHHSTIQINLTREISTALKGSNFVAYGSDLKLCTPDRMLYAYPDLSVVSGKPECEDSNQDVLTNPMVIFEILSPSTEAFDRGDKFRRYRTIPSLEEYVLVSQERPLVEIYRRKGIHWEREAIEGRDQVVRIESANRGLKLEEVFDRVEFPAEGSEN